MDIAVQQNQGIKSGDEVLDIFDESDWDFFNVASEFDYFGDCEDNFIEREPTKYEKISATVSAGVVTTIFLGVGTYLFTTWHNYAFGGDTIVITSDNKELVKVSGKSVDSATEIKVNKSISDYSTVLANNAGVDKLNDYCLNGSSIYSAEEKYRKASQFSFDTNDCYARSIRAFSSCISLQRVNKLVEKDGTYYAYCSVNVPDTTEFYDYYKSYASDLTYHFKATPLTLINITKYMLKLMDANKVPTRVIEIELQLKEVNGEYKIVSDDDLVNYCSEPYTNSVSQIADILGSKVFEK